MGPVVQNPGTFKCYKALKKLISIQIFGHFIVRISDTVNWTQTPTASDILKLLFHFFHQYVPQLPGFHESEVTFKSKEGFILKAKLKGCSTFHSNSLERKRKPDSAKSGASN